MLRKNTIIILLSILIFSTIIYFIIKPSTADVKISTIVDVTKMNKEHVMGNLIKEFFDEEVKFPMTCKDGKQLISPKDLVFTATFTSESTFLSLYDLTGCINLQKERNDLKINTKLLEREFSDTIITYPILCSDNTRINKVDDLIFEMTITSERKRNELFKKGNRECLSIINTYDFDKKEIIKVKDLLPILDEVLSSSITDIPSVIDKLMSYIDIPMEYCNDYAKNGGKSKQNLKELLQQNKLDILQILTIIYTAPIITVSNPAENMVKRIDIISSIALLHMYIKYIQTKQKIPIIFDKNTKGIRIIDQEFAKELDILVQSDKDIINKDTLAISIYNYIGKSIQMKTCSQLYN